jgi:hypothetical protein
MTINQSDLDSFHVFASEALSRTGRELNLEDLVQQWCAQHEREETIASIQRGVDDAEAGRIRDLGEVDMAIRAKLGFPPRSR